MRGRGHSSSSGSQKKTRMALRKQVIQDSGDSPSGEQQIDENTQEDKALDDGDDNDELSSSLLPPVTLRGKRRRERENKSKPKEMTEEEMMDLALRLSEQEASITALRQQREEEAMIKAIQESMVSQTHPDTEASLRISSRRKLSYPNGKPASPVDQGASQDVCTAETLLTRGAKRGGNESKRNKKRKRTEGSPLLEMPDLSQTQKIYSQASSSSSEVLDLPLDSPQSSDSTQIDDCQLCKSPVFPSTGCRAEVQLSRLSQNLLQACRTSGFVWCSQDSLASPQKSLPAQPKSPTFPKSSCNFTLSKHTASPKSPVFSETDQGDDGETELDQEYFKSPVFGRNTQKDQPPSACNPQVCNSGFTFSPQESLTSSVRSTSCRSQSPVFPGSPAPHPERSATCKVPKFSETDGEQTGQSHSRCISPAFGRTGRRQEIRLDVQKCSESVSPCPVTQSPSQSLRLDGETDHHQDIRSNEPSKSDDAKELKKMSKDRDSCEVELSSDMVLLWSDEDDGITPVGSPSPVFPEERPVHQADDQPAPLNHLTSRRPSASTSSSSRQQPPTTGPQPISIEETVGAALAPSGEPVGASTVHYYWGVPFCPRGLDPDSYTQVILAQMEVYEKSLKQAQRGLLQKAEWGEAILPQPEKSPSPSDSPVESPQQLPQRRGVRLRSKRLCDAADTPPAEQEVEEDNKGEEEQRESKDEDKQMEGGGEVDADDCEVCPETQLSEDDDRTQDLMLYTDSAAELRPKGPELPEVEMILQDESPAEDEPQEEEEMEVELDAPVDIQMKGNIPVRSSDVGGQHERQEEVEEGIEDPDVEEKRDQGLQSSTAPELEPAVVPQMLKSSVDCPICQGSFPVTEIEMHAAYCDGEVAITDERRPDSCRSQASLKSRRKRIRRAEGAAEEKNDFSNSVKYQEKCFICQKAVPLRDYSRHTELCIQRQTSKTAAKGNLLSALQKTESRDSDARPSGSKHQPGEIIDLRDDDEEEEEEEGAVSAIRISNSPIRSFTPISEATDCLIDFKKQNRPKKPSQRRR
uniref:BRCA1-A complex subunit RAP80 isoform X2 n=1 Tax=Scatophagus argus TaxID=75038 RepID=UPI001ED7DD49|nr:BRCA1-A complex subunit RAP80 isoform X2 [Scatophagus argus]